MEIAGIVLGALALLALVAAVVAFFVIRSKLRKLRNVFADAFGEDLPAEITLVPRPVPEEDEELMERVGALGKLGFLQVGGFDVAEMDPVIVVGMVHPEERVLAAVFRHPEAGVWTDLELVYETAGSLTVTNAPHGSEMDRRPAHHKIYEPSLDEQDLLDLLRRKAASRSRRSVKPGEFKDTFEADYAADMGWRMERGGPTWEEIERVADNMNGEFTAKEIASARASLAAQAAPELDKKVREALAATMTGIEWERAIRRGVIIRADLTLEDLEDPIYQALEDANLLSRYEEPVEACWEECLEGEASLNTIVKRVNAVLPEDHQFEKVSEITDPLEAKLYVLD